MTRKLGHRVAASALVLCAFAVSGCASDSYAAKGAAKGGGTGALAGAVGGAATALIFGGNVGEAAARGAVYGGASGAVVGGLSGAETDRRVAEQEQAEYERRVAEFREEIGSDAFNGFVALAECKYEIAVANAREAQRSRNRESLGPNSRRSGRNTWSRPKPGELVAQDSQRGNCFPLRCSGRRARPPCQ